MAMSVEELLADGLKDLGKNLDKLEGKLDKLDDRIDGISVTLAKQQVSLDEHIRRTDVLEKHVKDVQKELPAEVAKHVDEHFKKVNKARWEQFKVFVKVAGKTLSIAATSGLFSVGTYKIVQVLIKVFG